MRGFWASFFWAKKPEVHGVQEDQDRVEKFPIESLAFEYGKEAEEGILSDYAYTKEKQRQQQIYQALSRKQPALLNVDFIRIYDLVEHIGEPNLELLRDVSRLGISLDRILEVFDPFRAQSVEREERI